MNCKRPHWTSLHQSGPAFFSFLICEDWSRSWSKPSRAKDQTRPDFQTLQGSVPKMLSRTSSTMHQSNVPQKNRQCILECPDDKDEVPKKASGKLKERSVEQKSVPKISATCQSQSPSMKEVEDEDAHPQGNVPPKNPKTFVKISDDEKDGRSKEPAQKAQKKSCKSPNDSNGMVIKVNETVEEELSISILLGFVE